MNFIPILHFISAIALFGLLMYFFNPIVDDIQELTGFDDTNEFNAAMILLFTVIPAVNLFGAGIRFVIFMQGDKSAT